MDKALLKQIIIDFQEKKLPGVIPRKLKIKELSDLSIIITGARRSGKTYRTFQFIQDKINLGLNIQNICRLQFNDNRLLTLNKLELIEEAYYELFPEKLHNERVYFIFDEIHRVNGWEDYILQLMDNHQHSVLVTGSTSKLLTGDIASALRGKCYPHNIFPFCFKEFLAYQNVSMNYASLKAKSMIKKSFFQYLNYGGFPGLYPLERDEHIEMLQNYWDTMILKDIIESHPNDRINIAVFGRFAAMLITRNACPMTVRPLIKELKELGFNISPDTIYKYLKYLEEAFLIYTVPLFSKSQKQINLNYKKVYAIDWALANAISSGEGMSNSRRLENLVFLHLKQEFKKVSYYRTKQGHEIDFVVQDKISAEIKLIQVCYSLEARNVKDREIRSLVSAALFLGSRENIIIILEGEASEIQENKVLIKIIPVWEWILFGLQQ